MSHTKNHPSLKYFLMSTLKVNVNVVKQNTINVIKIPILNNNNSTERFPNPLRSIRRVLKAFEKHTKSEVNMREVLGLFWESILKTFGKQTESIMWYIRGKPIREGHSASLRKSHHFRIRKVHGMTFGPVNLFVYKSFLKYSMKHSVKDLIVF